MRGATVQVFDELIKDAGATWYTSAKFNEVLQNGDCFAIQAVSTNVSGGSPSLTVYLEQSEDTEDWVREATALFNAQPLTNGGTWGASRLGIDPVLSSFARFAITLGGSAPKCRLKLYVTVRAYEPQRSRLGEGQS